MSGSKGKIIFAILAVLLLLFGGGVTLYPFLNGFWVEYTFHRDAEEFLNHTAVVKEQQRRKGHMLSYNSLNLQNRFPQRSTPNSGWI